MTVSSSSSLVTPVARNWGWFLALGIFFVILGVVGLGSVFALTLATATLFGVLLIVGGVVQLMQAFQDKGWKGIVWHILIALLYLVAGGTMLKNPMLGSAIITAIIGGSLVGAGLFRLFLAFGSRKESAWFLLALSGLISFALGGMILSKWPVSGLWVIGVFVAIDLLMHGWSYIFLALAARRSTTAGLE